MRSIFHTCHTSSLVFLSFIQVYCRDFCVFQLISHLLSHSLLLLSIKALPLPPRFSSRWIRTKKPQLPKNELSYTTSKSAIDALFTHGVTGKPWIASVSDDPSRMAKMYRSQNSMTMEAHMFHKDLASGIPVRRWPIVHSKSPGRVRVGYRGQESQSQSRSLDPSAHHGHRKRDMDEGI
jgi:hypothetical protein